MPDVIKALIDYLLADATVSGLVGSRGFGGELPRAETDSMPRAAFVVRRSGGFQTIGSGYQEYGDSRYDVQCYGATPEQADELWRAVFTSLKTMRRTKQSGCLLHWAREAGGPLPIRDLDADWPYVISSWQIMTAEVAV